VRAASKLNTLHIVHAVRHWFALRMPAYRVLLASASAAGMLGCANQHGCDIGGVSRDLGGTGLIDCGIAGSDPSDVDACAVSAFMMRSTFRAIYEKKDGSLQGVIHAAGDTYYALRASAKGDAVQYAQCKSGSVVDQGTRTLVQCDKPGAYVAACK